MIDIVIPFRFSPFTNSVELKYCLRSIEKHVRDVGTVWVIGDRPVYLRESSTCQWVPFLEKDWYQYLTRNIHNKLNIACITDHVSDQFLYMNDDHFLLKDIEAETMPYYHSGNIWGGTGRYKITVASTLHKYPHANNFDIHTPMRIYKQLYKQSVALLDWKTPFGYAIKSSYCAHCEIVGRYYPDYKIDRKPIPEDFIDILGLSMFSVGDKAVNRDMVEFLRTLYPYKSKYEI